MVLMPKRYEYEKLSLSEKDCPENPFVLFRLWWEKVLLSSDQVKDAMVLSTSDEHNNPDSRVVLLKDFNGEGFYFFSNYDSTKGKQIKHNNNACLLFFWPHFEQQVRVKGLIEKTNQTISTNYFNSRPRDSKIAVYASQQSKKIDSRQSLEKNFSYFQGQFLDKEIPCPPQWGGYVLKPNYFEFWQGRKNRLHDRIVYEKMPNNNYIMSRLCP